MATNAIEAGTAAMLGVGLSLHTIATLVRKGTLSEIEARAIVSQAIASLVDPAQAEAARAMCKAIAAESQFTVAETIRRA